MSNKELYGEWAVRNVPQDICNERINILNRRLQEETEVPYTNQNNALITKLLKALNFWAELRDGKEYHG